jgi:beta-lactamase class D
MRNGQLPVRSRHIALVERLIELERREGWVLRGKTGLTEQDGRVVGWFVGFVEQPAGWIAYATLILGAPDDIGRVIPARKELTKKLLARFGVA